MATNFKVFKQPRARNNPRKRFSAANKTPRERLEAVGPGRITAAETAMLQIIKMGEKASDYAFTRTDGEEVVAVLDPLYQRLRTVMLSPGKRPPLVKFSKNE